MLAAVTNAWYIRADHEWHLYIAGVVSKEGDLINYFDNYIKQPVLSKAMPGSSDDQPGDNSGLK